MREQLQKIEAQAAATRAELAKARARLEAMPSLEELGDQVAALSGEAPAAGEANSAAASSTSSSRAGGAVKPAAAAAAAAADGGDAGDLRSKLAALQAQLSSREVVGAKLAADLEAAQAQLMSAEEAAGMARQEAAVRDPGRGWGARAQRPVAARRVWVRGRRGTGWRRPRVVRLAWVACAARCSRGDVDTRRTHVLVGALSWAAAWTAGTWPACACALEGRLSPHHLPHAAAGFGWASLSPSLPLLRGAAAQPRLRGGGAPPCSARSCRLRDDHSWHIRPSRRPSTRAPGLTRMRVWALRVYAGRARGARAQG